MFDLQRNESWRVENQLLKNTKGYEKITVANESLQFTDGIIGMALSKRDGKYKKDNRHLFFHSLNAITENSVPLSVLDDGEAFKKDPNSHAEQFKELGVRYENIELKDTFQILNIL